MTITSSNGTPVFLPNGVTPWMEGARGGVVSSVSHSQDRGGTRQHLTSVLGSSAKADEAVNGLAPVMTVTMTDGSSYRIQDVTLGQYGAFKARYGL